MVLQARILGMKERLSKRDGNYIYALKKGALDFKR